MQREGSRSWSPSVDLTDTRTPTDDHVTTADPSAVLLSGRPELRAAVDAVWSEAVRATRPALEEVRETERFPHPWVAEDIVYDTGVDPGRLHGRITVVAVPSPWWSLTAPGLAVAAAGITADPVAARGLLHTVLASSAPPV